jgi:hypothetical protein
MIHFSFKKEGGGGVLYKKISKWKIELYRVPYHSRYQSVTWSTGELTRASERWGPGGMVTRWLEVPSFPLIVSVQTTSVTAIQDGHSGVPEIETGWHWLLWTDTSVLIIPGTVKSFATAGDRFLCRWCTAMYKRSFSINIPGAFWRPLGAFKRPERFPSLLDLWY